MRLQKLLFPKVIVALLAFLPALQAEVIISEFLAENDTGLRDADGDQADWIELYNNGGSTVNLAGWRLTDTEEIPDRWVLPAVNLAADARLVIFASGKNRQVAGQQLHTNFSLKKDGGYLALSRPDGTITTSYAPYPEQKADISYGSGQLVDAQPLIVGTTAGKYRVPTNDSLGSTWTQPGFADASWTSGTSRLGYQTGGARPGLPISYWTFDNTMANEIPGAPELSAPGTSYNPSVPGPISDGNSLHFTRANANYGSAPLNVSETAYTCSFWFRTTQATTGMFVVVQGDLGNGGHDRHVFLNGGNISARTYNNETIISSGRNYADNQWHHVVHEYGGAVGGQRLYVDNVLRAQGTKANSDFDWQAIVNVGFSNDATAGQYHQGEIDDLAIWSEALSTASIQSLYLGTSPVDLAGFSPYIGTNTQTAMYNINPSVYLRLPFTVNRLTPFNTATLKVRYDDGFIAYLDGTEVARRNAPGTPLYNSTATGDRPATDAVIEETIDLSAFANLLGNGSHVLAVQGLNDAASSSEFLFNATLTGATTAAATAIYMDPPTPAAANSPGFNGFVADTSFNPKRGHYTTPQTVAITSATPGATIAYTTDGSEPSPANGIQVAPANASTPPTVSISVTSTRFLRAMAYKSGASLRPTNVDTHSYLFLNQVLSQSNSPAGYPASWKDRAADYAMDPNVINTALPGYSVLEGLRSLPSISMTFAINDLFGNPSGIYYDTQLRGITAEKRVSVEWINQDTTPGWQVQCGVRLHGNSSRSHSFTPKHPLRLFFRGDYGAPKLRQDIFGGGVAKFDQILLRAASTDSFPVVDGNVEDGEQRWNNDKATYIRDQYIRDLLNDLGSPNCRGTYVNLYLNGLYWGLYNVAERPTAGYFADTFGGEKEEWDVLKDFAEVNDGTAQAWNEMLAIVNDGTISDSVRCQKLIGNNPDGTRNLAYPIYINWPNLRDYMIVHIAAGAEDWPDHNYWVGRRRGALSDGFHFVAWDQEISNDSLTRTSGRGSDNPFAEVDEPGPAIVYNKFRRVEPFKTEFRDRIHALFFNGGPLAPASQRARWLLRQTQIDKAIVAESARWGDAAGEGIKKRETTWLNNMNYMNTAVSGYWDKIFPIDIARWRSVQLYPTIDQPTFSQAGGSVPVGFQLYLNHSEPTIYYTRDGSDPRAANGNPSAAASLYQGGQSVENVIAGGSVWKYLATPNAPASTWKNASFNDAAWAEGPGRLGSGTAVPPTTTIIGAGNTTYFRKAFTVSSKDGVLNATFRILRDDGAVIYLNGQELARSNMHPTNPITYGSFASTNVTGADESTFYYDVPVPLASLIVGNNILAVELHKVGSSDTDMVFDGKLDFVRSNPTSGIILNNSAIINARARTAAGEWSGVNQAYFSVGSQPPSSANLAITEIMYHPAAPSTGELTVSTDAEDFEFIEVRNISALAVELSGCKFTEGVDYVFPLNTSLAPGENILVVRHLAAFRARYGNGPRVAGVYGPADSLSNSGETVTLRDSANVLIQSVTYADGAPWPTSADGGGYSLVSIAPQAPINHSLAANWRASTTIGGNPNGSDSAVFSGSPTADADQDGLNAFLEFALGTSDQSPTPAATTLVAAPAGLLFTFSHPVNADDVLYTIESAQSLDGWGPANGTLFATTTNGNLVTETWLFNPPAGPFYVRLKVSSR